ncbi:hypothetical protein HBI56_083820 [Parastagonospora nodorum]|nr:hypothetical protein HBI10_118760 [Parastagonospora nodorum]KAH4025179.1 hypothetical protein HBI13_078430 [Parastagonospora nodorum]KAH4032531.1 hypothetical protein HBI09_120070 [Parastagonospora nodorum]KAH4191370.1 hypothetical protein HBH42_124500 [Parastagonospora nodorum]KAH4206214.1 hypothetical protein HBI95_125540 [Parastagonospora nodorum]
MQHATQQVPPPVTPQRWAGDCQICAYFLDDITPELHLPKPNPPQDELLPFVITSRINTPMHVFHNFILSLDNSAGETECSPHLDSQFYQTHLTAAQDEGLEDKYPFTSTAYAHVCTPEDVDRLVLFREEW